MIVDHPETARAILNCRAMLGSAAIDALDWVRNHRKDRAGKREARRRQHGRGLARRRELANPRRCRASVGSWTRRVKPSYSTTTAN
jgi:hypothetical protein